mgnify:CR=1 FL=1
MMERYREYKESGVKWLGEIPSHWEVFRNKDIFHECKKAVGKNSNNYTLLSLSKKGVVIRNMDDGGKFPAEFDTYKVVEPGDFIFCFFDVDETPRAVGLSSEYGMITGAYTVLRQSIANSQYLYYYYLSIDDAKALKPLYTGLRKTVPLNAFMSMQIFLPPLSEQDAIVRYLYSATSEIDKAIAMQQKMIDLLNERKQIIIQNAVTKGLDENVEMKESGVEWIGRIPKHWEVSKLKYIIKKPLKYGANEASEYIDYSCPRYIRITDIDSNGKLKEDTFRSLPRDKAEPYLLSKGDILFARSGATVGKAFLFEEEYKACYAGYLIKASFDNKKVLSKFVYLYTQTLAYQRWKESIFIQATIQNISGEKYSNMQIAIPPISEQKKLIDWLLPRLNVFDSAITNCQRQITLLQERKQIIINEVVTGKVRVI